MNAFGLGSKLLNTCLEYWNIFWMDKNSIIDIEETLLLIIKTLIWLSNAN